MGEMEKADVCLFERPGWLIFVSSGAIPSKREGEYALLCGLQINLRSSIQNEPSVAASWELKGNTRRFDSSPGKIFATMLTALLSAMENFGSCGTEDAISCHTTTVLLSDLGASARLHNTTRRNNPEQREPAFTFTIPRTLDESFVYASKPLLILISRSVRTSQRARELAEVVGHNGPSS
ncbi:hypothetical protein MKZ38_006976 [Zalerion maritima]|uniref:Uncharacterized protein n=1 Tax=Zalerion maritima TaxID=339359 RepID=A0AAD5WNG9_9PEZI|nr:hypothetical protein MKZ38_006976 [Zalerion maritima]